MKAKMSKAGGAMHKPFLAKGEKGTAKPAKQKVMAKVDEPRKRMLEAPGMQRVQRGPKGKVV